MIFAGILNIAIPLVILVQIVVSLLLVLVVLMQRPKQEGLGATFGAGMTDQMFGAQTTSVLQKATVWFGIIFFAATLLLTILVNQKNSTKQIAIQPTEQTVVDSLDKAEEESSVSLADQLKQAESTTEGVNTEVIEIKDAIEGGAAEMVEEVKQMIQAPTDKVDNAEKAAEKLLNNAQEQSAVQPQEVIEQKTSE